MNGMKTIKLLSLAIFLSILGSCEKDIPVKESNYVFVKSYCATVTVGGFVGISEKCFNVGDMVSGKEAIEGQVTIRIAEHSVLNEGRPGPNSYQEYLNVPSENLVSIAK